MRGSLDRALDISVSALNAERLRMELISSNIANVSTTRSLSGGPYRRKVAVFGESQLSFDDQLSAAQKKLEGGGVELLDIMEDNAPFQKVYNPSHPDADKEGYVSLPNVNLATEMVDMVSSSKMYEANVTAFNSTKKMMQDTLQIQ